MRILIGILCVAAAILNAQVVIEKEELSGKQYTLTLINHGYPYTISNTGGIRTIHFDYPEDESRPGEYRLPHKDLFIALPYDPKLTYRFTSQSSEHISDVTPERTSTVKRMNDSLVEYSTAEGPVILQQKNIDLVFNGFLWIGNTFCGHFTVNPYALASAQNGIVELKRFQIQFIFASLPARKQIVDKGTIHPLIINEQFAPQWSSTRPAAKTSLSGSWIDYNLDYLKLGVFRDAIYRLSYTDLKNSGVPVSTLDPRTIRMFLKGGEIPLYVQSSGTSDGTFDSTDFIEFVGRKNYGDVRYRDIAPAGAAYYEYLNLYSDTTMYWLTWGGIDGKRVDTTTSYSGSPVDTTRYYDDLTHRETNLYYDFSYSNQVEREYPQIKNNKTWLDNGVGVGTLTSAFTVSNLFTGRSARAFIKLQDYSANISSNAHNLSLSLNSYATTYDSGFINKYQMKVMKMEFNSSLLANGSNSVKLNSYSVPANTINVVLRDWAELEYPRQLNVANDTLMFSYRNLAGKKLTQFILTGLSVNPVVLYRFFAGDSSIIKITNYTRNSDTLRFVDSVAEGTHYFISAVSKTLKPVIYYKKKFVNLRSTSNKADYLAITHPYFISLATSYVSFIASSYNVTAKLINVNDIFDEFNYGFTEPEPIRDFLQTTQTNWQNSKPKNVLIIGKATYDYYGYKNKTAGAPKIINFVPSYGSPVSDTWFVIWDSTGALIPQMNIGRVPAKSIDEFQSYFLKHQKYLSKGYDDWNKRFLFFSGGSTSDPNQIAQAKGTNDFIINNYASVAPIGGIITNFYKTNSPTTNFGPYSAEYVKNSIEQGGVFISYIGHSGTQTWDNSITDITQLANIRDRNPMVSDFGCSTGKFAEPDILSFSELSVNSLQGQAISYIGNSSLGFTSTAYTFPQVFYKKLLKDTTASIGDVHRLAKIDYVKQYGMSGSYGLFVQTNTLIGDPIVQLPIPVKPNLSFTNSIVTASPDIPSDQTDSVLVRVNYFNIGAVTTDSVRVSIQDSYSGSVAYSSVRTMKMPLFTDTMNIAIPIKGKSGEHTISLALDPVNAVDEIYENDNTIQYAIAVVSNSLRTSTLTLQNNQFDGRMKFLNPAHGTSQTDFLVDVSLQKSFQPMQSYSVPFGSFYSSYSFDTLYRGKRIWIRPKLIGSNLEGTNLSLIYGATNNVLYSDSAAWSTTAKVRSKVQSGSVVLDTTSTILSAISAGFNDGNTGVIFKDGQNLVPENTIRGHHIVLIDASTYEFKGYYLYDVTWGAVSAVTNYKNLLDTLSSNYLVIFSICSEGGGPNLTTALKTSIKAYGSTLIDSVKTGYYSWAMIGRKGATQGSVPEKFSKPFSGRVQIDTTIKIPSVSATVLTQKIGPVNAWRSIQTKFSTSNNSGINLDVIGYKGISSAPDTVMKDIPIDTLISLSSIDASLYTHLQLNGKLSAGTGKTSPVLSTLAVNAATLPELGTNDQVFKGYRYQNNVQGAEIVSSDTIVQGEKILLKYRIYNAGETTAKSVPVKLSSIWDNNYTEQLGVQTIDSISAESYKELSTVYNTSLGNGKRTVQVTIDPDTTIREIYKDNNLFTYPLIIKKSEGNQILPNLSITQNAVTSVPADITDETDTAKFTIIYSNTGSLVNDSISIQVKHYFQSGLLSTSVIRRKYPVSYDTLTVKIPILKNAGQHQLTVDLDHTGLIVESTESDNSSSYFFTVATTDFKVLFPTQNSITSVNQIIFLNPTTAAASSTIAMDIDSLSTFTNAQSISKQMQQFATTFGLPGLKKNKRYYWRVKVAGSAHDWTTGSFFSGDTSASSLGQIDSVAWKQNIFVRTAFSADSGVRIVDTRSVIKAFSAGFSDGNNGSITVNGINVVTPILGSGHNIVVLDSTSFAVVSQRRFNITADANEADSLIQYISGVTTGTYVVDVVVDEGANNLTTAARNALKSIGSASIDLVSFRDSWSIIGRKGASPGTVPETYRAQNSGSAQSETTVVRVERNGSVETPLIGPFTTLSELKIDQNIPSGAQVKIQLVGLSPAKTYDTLLTVVNQNTISLSSVNTKIYRNGKLIFTFTAPSSLKARKSVAAVQSPSVKSWKMSANPSTELAVSSRSSVINRNQVMEGEQIQFTGTVYNVSNVAAESVLVQLKTNASGIANILKQQRFAQIPPNDSVSFSYSYDTRGRRGNHSFTFEIDPKDSLSEQSKGNNSVSLPYIVQSDTLRPTLQITFDGTQILNGDYVSQHPEIRIKFTDNNPVGLLASDTANFKIKLNNLPVHFVSGTAELSGSSTPGRADVRWTPSLVSGENIIQIFAKDVSENYSDTILLYVNVASEFMIMDLFNLPNPFNNQTAFTFGLAGPRNPDEIIIKIYTVAGRLIQELNTNGIIGFNKIPWDGRDKDGDQIGNGVYLYKLIVKQGDKQIEALSKLVKMR
ncbi:MAG: C25 family cysteine peptidase [Bacteroidota bacterium]